MYIRTLCWSNFPSQVYGGFSFRVVLAACFGLQLVWTSVPSPLGSNWKGEIYHNSSRITRFLFRFCVSIQWQMTWRVPLRKSRIFFLHFVQCLSHHRCVQGFLVFVQQQFWDLLCLFTQVLAQHNYSESQDSVLGPFSKIRGRAKAVLGAHALQLSSRSDQNHRCRFARQPLMGDLMVMLRLKLCNSNCLDSRCTPKNDPLFEDSEDLQNKGHMKSSLDGRLSTFSDSSFETVCLFCLLTARHENIWLLHALLRSLNESSSPASNMDIHSDAPDVPSETEAWRRS